MISALLMALFFEGGSLSQMSQKKTLLMISPVKVFSPPIFPSRAAIEALFLALEVDSESYYIGFPS